MPAPREYTHQVPPGNWFSSDEYLTDVNWEIPVGDPAAYSARLDPRDADEWDQDFGMQRLKDISIHQCPPHPWDLNDDPHGFERWLASMHQALVGLQDEALMDMEAKYIKN